MAKNEYVWIKLSKPWGGFEKGEVVKFGQPKGQHRLDAGDGVEVPEPAESRKATAAANAKAAEEAKAAKEAEAAAKKEAEGAEAKATADKGKADKKAKTENADNRPGK